MSVAGIAECRARVLANCGPFPAHPVRSARTSCAPRSAQVVCARPVNLISCSARSSSRRVRRCRRRALGGRVLPCFPRRADSAYATPLGKTLFVHSCAVPPGSPPMEHHPPRQIAATLCHGVRVLRFEYKSPTLAGTTTRFHALVPVRDHPLPILYFLSGLTSTDENCAQKGAACQALEHHGLAMILPDTSPRGAAAPGEDDHWEFGTGAGFYVDATTKGFEAYQMYTFITEELPRAVAAALGSKVDTTRAGITGHSMGGHGALVLGMRNPQIYKSITAFAPIANPSAVPWGHTCFGGYLGNDEAVWKDWDATEILKSKGTPVCDHILIDQGLDDQFLTHQLKPDAFKAACRTVGQKLTLRMHPGYGHGYFFVSTFMPDHIKFHVDALRE